MLKITLVAPAKSKTMVRAILVTVVLASAGPAAAQAPASFQRALPFRGSWSLAAPGAARPLANSWNGSPWAAICAAPYKLAAGACVLSCPGGYSDEGHVCIHRNEGGGR